MRFARLAVPLLLAAPAASAADPGPYDLASAQRGYAVYAGVCSACHSIRQLTYGDLGGLGLDPDQLHAIAGAHRVGDGVDAAGHAITRPARLSDPLPSPFPSEAAARAANNGALPPDMSRLALTEPGGADYIARLLTSYDAAPPAGQALEPGNYANAAAPGGQIAMPPPLVAAGQVRYADGTPATVPQMAHDVASFLDWVAHPHAAARRRLGISVLAYLLLLIALLFLLKRRIWLNAR